MGLSLLKMPPAPGAFTRKRKLADYSQAHIKLMKLADNPTPYTVEVAILSVLNCAEVQEMLAVNRVSPGRSHESMIQDLANLVRHKKLCSPFAVTLSQAYVAADNIIICNKPLVQSCPKRVPSMSSLGLNRGSDPTGQADAYAGRSSLGELLRSLPPPPTTLSGMRGEYLQLVQDLATDMQATRNHL